MKFRSPGDSEGNGDELSDLQNQLEHLKFQIEEERKTHQQEMKRGLEAFQRLQKNGDNGKEERFLVSVDGHELSPHQRVGIFVDVQNMYYAARNIF